CFTSVTLLLMCFVVFRSLRRAQRSTLFPYTTLFRSGGDTSAGCRCTVILASGVEAGILGGIRVQPRRYFCGDFITQGHRGGSGGYTDPSRAMAPLAKL